MQVLLLPFTPRYILLTIALTGTVAFGVAAASFPAEEPYLLPPLVIFACFLALGIRDLLQTRHAILRNYPIAAHIRFILEHVRPELRQYFFEAEKDGTPFPRDKRAIVYQRAKQQLDTRPFGTHYDVYRDHYEWLHHSMQPAEPSGEDFRTVIGGPECAQPYAASVFNISAMSYGSLSANAIRALNKGAKLGGFAHDTGEGGVSPYHREHGGDLIWEVGSGYFCCRDQHGGFSAEQFAAVATDPQIKMIELKLSQGAKPGHGGILPAAKVTEEVAAIRGVKPGCDCVSPARHSAFSTPAEMMKFIDGLRRLSGGKPTGFKLCVGHPWEFLALVKAMLKTGATPDFMVVDGTEGHRRGAARIHGPYRHAAPRGPDLRAFGLDRRRPPRRHQDRRLRQDHLRLRHGAGHGARRRLVQFGAWLHVRHWLPAIPAMPHRSLSDRRRHPGQTAPTRGGGLG